MSKKVTLEILVKDRGSFKVVSTNANDLKSALSSVLGEAKKVSGSFLSGSFKSLLGPLASVTAAAAAVGAAIKGAVTNIANFERANATLASVLGTSTQDIKDLTQAAKDLGRTSEFTATNVTELQTALARLGFGKDQILAMQEPVLKFASAVGTDLASAADFTGSSLRAFGLNASDTGTLLDQMAAATSKSALDFSKLSTSISIVGPIAKSFGLSVSETASFLGVLANNGFDASSAATALRNILLNLSNSNGKLAKGIGHSVKSFDDIIKAFQELSDKGVDVNSVLKMTDQRSAAAAQTLISSADAVKTLNGELGDCDGALNSMYDTMTDNVIGATRNVQSAWESLTLAFEKSKGPIKDVLQYLADALNYMTALIEGRVDEYKFDLAVDATIKSNKDAGTDSYESYIEGIDLAQNKLDELKQKETAFFQAGGVRGVNPFSKQVEIAQRNLDLLVAAKDKLYGGDEFIGPIYDPNKIVTPKGGGGGLDLDEEKYKGDHLIKDAKSYAELGNNIKYYQNKLKETSPDQIEAIANLTDEINKLEEKQRLLVQIQDLHAEIQKQNDQFENALKAGLEQEKKALNESLKEGKTLKEKFLKDKAQKELNWTLMAADLGLKADLVIDLQTRTEGVEKAKEKIESLKQLLAVTQGEERASIEAAIVKWRQYIDTQEDVSSRGEKITGAMGNVASMMDSLSGVVDDDTSGWLSWGANVLSSIAQVLPELARLVGGHIAEAFAGAAAQSQTLPPPFNIISLAASMAAVGAAVAKIPAFAEGGLALKPTIGLFGEAGPEAIIPLDRLPSLLGEGAGGVGGKVEFKIAGRDLLGVLNREQTVRARG